MVVLEPTKDELPDLVRILVDLADSVYHVESSTDTPQLSIVIPDYLWTRYRFYMELDAVDDSSLPVRKKRSSK